VTSTTEQRNLILFLVSSGYIDQGDCPYPCPTSPSKKTRRKSSL